MNALTVVCAGELLWDVLPDGRTLGGAPANVAYHLGRLGLAPQLVTRVGRDEPGDAALALLRARGLDVAGVQVDDHLPTGAAHVVVDAHGHAGYQFVTPAAWDALEAPGNLSPDLLVSGTLARRDARSASAIAQLGERARLRAYDVNLRPPYTSLATVAAALPQATLVKLNADEVGTLAGEFGLPVEHRAFAAALAERFGPRIVCITRGGDGAALWADGEWHEATAPPTTVVDTVGAGDAFLAALTEAWLRGRPWPLALARANRLGAAVAARRGAMPDYVPELLEA